jgi:hypothetical protein
MKTIALTGNPIAQDAAHLQLQALINGRALPIRVRIGLTRADEAHQVHEEGGAVWHCGTEAPRPELAGAVDRTLPTTTWGELGEHVAAGLTQFMGKLRVGA